MNLLVSGSLSISLSQFFSTFSHTLRGIYVYRSPYGHFALELVSFPQGFLVSVYAYHEYTLWLELILLHSCTMSPHPTVTHCISVWRLGSFSRHGVSAVAFSSCLDVSEFTRVALPHRMSSTTAAGFPIQIYGSKVLTLTCSLSQLIAFFFWLIWPGIYKTLTTHPLFFICITIHTGWCPVFSGSLISHQKVLTFYLWTSRRIFAGWGIRPLKTRCVSDMNCLRY